MLVIIFIPCIVTHYFQDSPHTWKIVGDNLDLTVRVRDLRMDNRDKSVHFFHHMAVQERVPSSHLEGEEPMASITTLNFEDILPSEVDYQQLRSNSIILLSRIITSRLERFKSFNDVVPKHIQHKHYDAMKKKSNVVSRAVTIIIISICSDIAIRRSAT